MKVLVVDDEKEIADLVELFLCNEKYEVVKFYSSRDAQKAVDELEVDLAILDVMMPHVSGFDLCRQIRQRHHYPVIMLTAKGEDVDKITGLTLGADDYITKPFNPMELVARVKAQLRRYTLYNENREQPKELYDNGGLLVNPLTHECTVYGKEIVLTPKEFDILWLLCQHAGQVVSSEQIFESVWKEKYLNSNNTVMVHIRRLREKMGEPARNPRLIKTIWGVGYKLNAE